MANEKMQESFYDERIRLIRRNQDLDPDSQEFLENAIKIGNWDLETKLFRLEEYKKNDERREAIINEHYATLIPLEKEFFVARIRRDEQKKLVEVKMKDMEGYRRQRETDENGIKKLRGDIERFQNELNKIPCVISNMEGQND